MRHNTASFFVPMKPQSPENLNPENITSPEITIDGRVWLREILRNSKPKYIYALEDREKLQQIREAISNDEIAFLSPGEEKINEQAIIDNIREQKRRDLHHACPEQIKHFIKERR